MHALDGKKSLSNNKKKLLNKINSTEVTVVKDDTFLSEMFDSYHTMISRLEGPTDKHIRYVLRNNIHFLLRDMIAEYGRGPFLCKDGTKKIVWNKGQAFFLMDFKENG